MLKSGPCGAPFADLPSRSRGALGGRKLAQNANNAGRFQSGVLLPLARRVFLLGAGLAFLAMLAALVAAAYFWFTTPRADSRLADPQPSLNPIDVRRAMDAPAPLTLVVQTLSDSARNIDGALIAEIKSTEDGNEISSASIIRGADSDLFKFSLPEVETGSIYLYATESFWASYSLKPATVSSEKVYVIELNYTDSRDKSGKARFDFRVPFRTSARSSRSSQESPRSSFAPQEPPSEAELAAQAIAELVDPEVTTKYFDAYSAAKERIVDCADNSDEFARALRKEIQANSGYFTDQHFLLMLGRVCAEWQKANDVVAAASAAMAEERVRRQQTAFVKRGLSVTSVTVAGVALAILFLLIFPLSHLAMEDHLRAIREKK